MSKESGRPGPAPSFYEGDMVVFKRGPYSGMEGTIVENVGRTRRAEGKSYTKGYYAAYIPELDRIVNTGSDAVKLLEPAFGAEDTRLRWPESRERTARLARQEAERVQL